MRFVPRVALLVVLVSLLCAPAASAAPRGAKRAAALKDSVGVVTHAVYFDTAYSNWPRLLDRLDEIGIRHLRDGLSVRPGESDWNRAQFDRINAARARGKRFTFILGEPGDGGGTLDARIRALLRDVPGAAEALEGPNEYDLSGDPSWAANLRAYQRSLYLKASAQPALASLPVLAPSLVRWWTAPSSWELLGDIGAYADRGNIHPYTGAQSPTASILNRHVAPSALTSPGKLNWVTETGFHNALATDDPHRPASESAAAVYSLRTVLEFFKAGIQRTYFYELVDQSAEPARLRREQHFGLLRSDYTLKPAAVALKNLLAVLGSPRSVQAPPLDYTALSNTAGVQQLLLHDPDRGHLLVAWQTASVWNRDTTQPIALPAKRFEINVPGLASARSFRPLASSAARSVTRSGDRVTVDLPGDPIIIELRTG